MNKIKDKIIDLKKKRNAVILVHNYQPGEIQDIADYLGDSLDLSRKAARAKADVIVFCGVHFMAQTASILCPDKTVLLPEINAGCPMSDMADLKSLIELKKKNPGVPVVCYINTTAEIKTECDLCCTSANAGKIVKSINSDKVIFVPDKNLGHYTGKNLNKNMVLWNGYCPVHMNILPENIRDLKKKHPDAEVLVHPECCPEAVNMADKVLSTTGICSHCKESSATEFILGTENGIIYRLEKENPGKTFYPASELAVCKNMKKITLEKVLHALEDMKYEIKVDAGTRNKAGKCINAMLELSG